MMLESHSFLSSFLNLMKWSSHWRECPKPGTGKKIQNLNAGALLTPPETPGVVQKGLCSAISFLSTPTQPAPLGPYEFLSDAPS